MPYESEFYTRRPYTSSYTSSRPTISSYTLTVNIPFSVCVFLVLIFEKKHTKNFLLSCKKKSFQRSGQRREKNNFFIHPGNLESSSHISYWWLLMIWKEKVMKENYFSPLLFLLFLFFSNFEFSSRSEWKINSIKKN